MRVEGYAETTLVTTPIEIGSAETKDPTEECRMTERVNRKDPKKEDAVQ